MNSRTLTRLIDFGECGPRRLSAESLGKIQRVSIPSFDAQRLRRACLILVEHALARDLPLEWRVRLSPHVAPMADYGDGVTPDKVEASRIYLDTVRRETAAVFAQVDALVMPTAGQAAFEWAREAPAGLAGFWHCPVLHRFLRFHYQ